MARELKTQEFKAFNEFSGNRRGGISFPERFEFKGNFLRTGSQDSGEWVHDWHASIGEILLVAGGHGESMSQCGCCDHAVLDGHGLAGSTEVGEELRPA